jgi:hypothetical protein
MTAPLIVWDTVLRQWGVTDDGDNTVAVALTPTEQGRIAEYVADPDWDVTLAVVATPRSSTMADLPEPAVPPAPLGPLAIKPSGWAAVAAGDLSVTLPIGTVVEGQSVWFLGREFTVDSVVVSGDLDDNVFARIVPVP